MITLDSSEVDEAPDLAVAEIEDESSSLFSEPNSPSLIFVEKSRTMLLSLSMTTLLTRLVTSAISVQTDLSPPKINKVFFRHFLQIHMIPDTAGTVGILTGFPRTLVCLIPAYWPNGHERMVDLKITVLQIKSN